MKTLLASAIIVAASATGAFAQSSALDVYEPVKNDVAVDYRATSSIGGTANEFESRARLGDGSPQYDNNATGGAGIDFGATASIGQIDENVTRDRLGDGSPRYF